MCTHTFSLIYLYLISWYSFFPLLIFFSAFLTLKKKITITIPPTTRIKAKISTTILFFKRNIMNTIIY